MIRHILSAAAVAVFLPAAAWAQSSPPASAPIPQNGTLVDPGEGTPVSKNIKSPGLPGVDFEGGGEDVRGPGGLQNNVGAAGMALPSTSSENPVPIMTPDQKTLDGVPVGAGSPE
ncbi:hypothetical protein [Aurantimonas sp. VKM B-3413]|uniref:hypothetical protein n=1 Tax=Aurantimonas sp. VKM B-3413 TaxID=2779401 RepID=UPI001E60B2AA|nr:hypothetical protein [Aurantimonas sp. VKM B-3413]MCB8836921.1 hypothetical protein [Aurantimonas sp. VKM B-3413]